MQRQQTTPADLFATSPPQPSVAAQGSLPAPDLPADGPLSRATSPTAVRTSLGAVFAFLVVAIAALTWAKWWPYSHKLVHVLASHTFAGTSALTAGHATPPHPSLHAATAYTVSYLKAIWIALVAALLIAAAVETFLPRRWLLSALHSGRRGFRGSAAGGALSLPGMMCTCCTAPIAVSARRQGAPVSSTLSYWVGNPALNPAVLAFLAIVLPWRWVGVRLAAGVLLVFVLMPLVAKLDRRPVVTDLTCEQPASEEPTSGAPDGLQRFVRSLLRFSVTLLPEYLVIVFALGAFRGWLFPIGHHLAAWGPLAILLLAVAGTLFVIPTAAEIPIIQGLMHAGLGAGALGALLVTLPAVSLPSLAMVGRSFPLRVLVGTASAVAVVGVAAGVSVAALGS